MKTQKEILKWLQANLGRHCTAPLTSNDCYALVTSVNLSNLISHSSAPPELFAAYGAIVSQMQPHTRGLAYHAIACELDWSHRDMIWGLAGLPAADKPKHKCAFEQKHYAISPQNSLRRTFLIVHSRKIGNGLENTCKIMEKEENHATKARSWWFAICKILKDGRRVCS